MNVNVPNALVVARIAAIVPLFLLLQRGEAWAAAWALAVFIAAAASDVVDGVVARRLGQVTRLGTFLDPLADKLLVLTALLSLQQRGIVPTWVVLVVVARELVVTNLRAVAAARGYSIGASAYGKAKSVVQYAATSALLLLIAWPSSALADVAYSLLAAAVALTVLSGADYLAKASWAIAGRGVPTRWRLAPRDGAERAG